MARYIKQFDPEETQRRIAVEIQEAHCPGLLEFLSTLPYGYEGPGLRAIVYQWFLDREADGTLHTAFEAVVNGPGGLAAARLPKTKERPIRRTSSKPAVQANRSKRTPRAAEEVVTHLVSLPVTVVGVQEPAQTPSTATIVQPLPVPETTLLVQPQATDVAPFLVAEPPLTAPTLEDGPVDFEKVSPVVIEALMNLETMFG